MTPLIFITNDDGYLSRGLRHLADTAKEFGDVVVVAPESNASGQSTSITCARPLRVRHVGDWGGVAYHACSGTPADCVKMGTEQICTRRPDLVLSGINFGSNASINIIYSGTMGAVLEGCLSGFPSIGFSLLHHNPEGDLSGCTAVVQHILSEVLAHPLPDWTGLNVNIPRLPADQIKGIRICRQARAVWRDSLEKRIDPAGQPYYWMTGKFVCNDMEPDSDMRALTDGYVSVVPVRPDFTHCEAIPLLGHLAKENCETTA